MSKTRKEDLFRIRKTLGWNEATAALAAGVSPRTISLWESGAQDIPDSRWRLFLLEVGAYLKTLKEMVVLVHAVPGATGRLEEQMLDVISASTYIACVLADDGLTGVVASHYADRQGTAQIHRSTFDVSLNQGALQTFSRWEANTPSGMTANERQAYTLHRWLVRRTIEAELQNPHVAKLKADVDRATQVVANASEAELPAALKAQTAAIDALIAGIHKAKEG